MKVGDQIEPDFLLIIKCFIQIIKLSYLNMLTSTYDICDYW